MKRRSVEAIATVEGADRYGQKGIPILFLCGLVTSLLKVCGINVFVRSLGTLREGQGPIELAINNWLILLSYACFGALLAA